MVTKEQLRDWLDADTRRKRIAKIEEVLDRKIKENALAGKTTFYVSTGETNNITHRHHESHFYDTWHNEDLSEESRGKIKREVLRKYREAGFEVDVVDLDHGWNSSYEAVRFRNIHKLVEDDAND